MDILVTGAKGQLGTEVRTVSARSAHNFIFTDVNDDENTLKLDVTDPLAVRRFFGEHHIDVVVNCAAYTNVDKAEEDYPAANKLNNKAVAYLAAAAFDKKALLIHISTDYVFKGDENLPYEESCTTSPVGVYGVTKLMGEKSVQISGCRYMIFRTSWLYSPYGKNFVKTMRKLTAEKSELKVVFDQVGTPTFARDLASLIVKIIDENMLEHTGIYHFSDEGVCSWYDFACEVNGFSGHTCDIQPCLSHEFPSKVRRPHFSVLNKHKVKNTFGISIPYWRDSLQKCMAELDAMEQG